MNEYNEGDLVEAVHKEGTVIRDRVARRKGSILHEFKVATGFAPLEELGNYGWTVTVVEKAAPKVELPTEPGIYADRFGESATLHESGRWFSHHDGSYTSEMNDAELRAFAPFTRLEPVPVTAKKVLDEVRKFAWADGYMSQLEAVAKEFGVPNV